MTWTGRTFSFRHNWALPVRERLAWLTDVMTKRSGKEQRVRVRAHPRRTLEYSLFLYGAQARRRFQELVWGAQDEEVMAPVWADKAKLAGVLASGATSISVNTEHLDYDDGAHLMLWADEENFEVLEIDTVSPSSVSLAEATSREWPAGTYVCPARRARLAPSISGAQVTRDRERFPTVALEVSVGEVSANRVGSYTPRTHRSVEMYEEMPEGSEEPGRELARQLNRLDYETGGVYVDAVTTAPSAETDFRRKLATRAEVAELLGWLGARAGRCNPFWHPTWDNDFELLSMTTGQITVREAGYAATYDVHDARRNLALRTKVAFSSFSKGDWIPLRVNSAADNGDGTETLSVTGSALALARPVTDFSHLSFLRFARLQQDAVELVWETDRFVKVGLRFKELLTTP